MQWVTYSRDGQARTGALLDGRVIDLEKACLAFCAHNGLPATFQDRFTSMIALLSSGRETLTTASDCIRFALANTSRVDTKDAFPEMEAVILLPPIPNPGKIICVGGNFPAAGKLSAPEYPVIFLKPSTTLTGPGMPIRIPKIAGDVGYEVELAVVIGREAQNLTEDSPLDCIAGYLLANDIGDRLLEKRTSQWTSGKMFDTFTPIGPAILTPDEVGETRTLGMQTWVNDQQVQKGSTGEMFFDVGALVRYISTLTRLEPGDLILTGSPKLMDGEPAPKVSLKPGDRVRIVIDCLGELTNPVEAAPA